MRYSQSALLGVGPRASGEIGSEIPVAVAAEMTGVSPADRTGVRDAWTTTQTRGIEAHHAHGTRKGIMATGVLVSLWLFPGAQVTQQHEAVTMAYEKHFAAHGIAGLLP